MYITILKSCLFFLLACWSSECVQKLWWFALLLEQWVCPEIVIVRFAVGAVSVSRNCDRSLRWWSSECVQKLWSFAWLLEQWECPEIAIVRLAVGAARRFRTPLFYLAVGAVKMTRKWRIGLTFGAVTGRHLGLFTSLEVQREYLITTVLPWL